MQVSASSGSVKLTLWLHSRKTKINSFPEFQLTLSNIGKTDMVVSDPVFSDSRAMKRNISAHYGLFVEIKGPDNRPLQLAPPRQFNEPATDEELKSSGLLSVKGEDEERMVADWKRQGLSQQEINRKLLAYHSRTIEESAARNTQGFRLEPGKRAEVKAKFDLFDFDRPGSYRIRAVYDRRVDEASRKKYGFQPLPGDVLVQTRWITFEVVK